MVELNDNLMFSQGGRRCCFHLPDDPTRCIKTLSEAGDPSARKREAIWYKKLRPASHFDDNLRERVAFKQLESYGDAVWTHFPKCYGMQETNRGRGIVMDLICDQDGSISKTVRQYIQEQGITSELRGAVDEFFDFLLTNRIVTRDILDHNLVVSNSAGSLRLVMIDGFGCSEWIPVSVWLPWIGQRKVCRKIDRFKKRYGFL